MKVNFSDENVLIDSNVKSIFLAGPTRRNSPFSLSWRKEACDLLEAMNFNGIVYVPEKDHAIEFNYLNQVDWERKALMTADTILFYIPRKLPEMPGFTTNVEFGMYLSKRPEAVEFCSPENAEGNRYLEWLYKEEKPNAIIYRELNKALKACIL